MVVARKTPVAPAPPASRSSSSQALPRALKAKATPTVNGTSATNGKTLTHSKVKSKSSQVKRKPKPAGASFSRRVFLLLISVFSIYAVTVCRTDFPRTSSVCRSLDTYRTHILDPYILPPLQSLLHHTEPHLAPLQPYVTSVKPYVTKTVAFTRTHVAPRASAVLSFTIAQYNKHLAPRIRWFFIDQYWNGIIKPIYYKGIHPTLEYQTRPYRLYYHRFLVPYARKAAVQAQVTYDHTRPHAISYIKLAGDQARNAYKFGKPHALKAYAQVRPYAVAGLSNARARAFLLTRKAGEARRKLVDPHVRRILEKVGETRTASSSSIVPASTATQASVDEPTPVPTPDAATVPLVLETTTFITVEETITVVEQEPEPTPETSSEIPAPSAPAPVAESPVPATEAVAESAASIVAASLHAPDATQETLAATPVVVASAASVPEPVVDVDDFLKDIGLDDDATEKAPVVTSTDADASETDPVVRRQSQPSPEERKRIMAEKRQEITGRHKKWQEDLTALIEAHTNGVRTTLAELRRTAVGELEAWGTKGVLGDVEEEATRLVNGLEGYLKGVEAKGAETGKGATEEQKWHKVLEKVEGRFSDKVRDVQRDVHKWFVEKVERETQEVQTAVATIKSFAERAQGDIGLDYAWLDDVTYYDWQKYHDLMRASENFTRIANTLQATVDPRGSNILIDALNDLEAEMNEVVEGFTHLVGNVRRRAEGPGGVFSPEPVSEPETGKETSEEDKVSILPIEPQPTEPVGDKKEGSAIGVEDVLLGRSKEEVEAKLASVPVERAGREEL